MSEAPHSRIAIIANGEIPHPEKIKPYLMTFPYLIAVDGGCNHCHQMGLYPDLIIGDLDSAKKEILDFYLEVPKMISHSEKDKTDLEIALEHTFKTGDDFNVSEVVVFGGLDGRVDHTLGNICLLTRYPGKVFLESDRERVFVIDREVAFSCAIGQTISLIPLNGPATGITTEGLKWEMKNGTLDKHFIGISNEATHAHVKIHVKAGDLLCVISRGGPFSPCLIPLAQSLDRN